MIRLLLYAEDPGAANFLGPVASAARAERSRYAVEVLARHAAVGQFLAMDVPCEKVDEGVTAEDVLRRFDPTLVAVGTAERADTFAFDLVAAARDRGVVSLGVVDAVMNAEFRFRGSSADPLAHAPDWLAVTDDATKAALVGLGFAASRIAVVGHPHFDTVRDAASGFRAVDRTLLRRRVFPRAGEGQCIVAFLAELSSGFDNSMFRRSADYTLGGSGRYDGRTEIVMEELVSACASLERPAFLSLRLHPKCAPDAFTPLSARFDEVRQGGNALEYVFAADLVVGMSTSLLAEAAIMGRPTLSILPRECEREWIPAAAREAIPVATTPAGILAGLQKRLDDRASVRFGHSNEVQRRAVDRVFELMSRALE